MSTSIVRSDWDPMVYEVGGIKLATFREPCIVNLNSEAIADAADKAALFWWQEHGKEDTDGEAYRALVRVIASALTSGVAVITR